MHHDPERISPFDSSEAPCDARIILGLRTLLPAAERWEKMGWRCAATAGEALETTTLSRWTGSVHGTRLDSGIHAPARIVQAGPVNELP